MRTLALILLCFAPAVAQGDTYAVPQIGDEIPVAAALQPTQKPQAAQIQKPQALQKPQAVQAPRATQKPQAAQVQKAKGFGRDIRVEGRGLHGRLTVFDRLRLLRKIRQAQREDRRLARSSRQFARAPQEVTATVR